MGMCFVFVNSFSRDCF